MDEHNDPWQYEVWTEGTIYRESSLDEAQAITREFDERGVPYCLIERTAPFWEDGSTYTVLRGDVSVIESED